MQGVHYLVDLKYKLAIHCIISLLDLTYITIHLLYFITDSKLAALITMANRRRMNYLRPGSKKNLLVHIRSFLSFCIFYRKPEDSLDVNMLCAYVEFLLNSFSSPSTVRNYISSLATFQSWRGLSTEFFNSLQVSQLWRAIDLTVRHFPRQVHILSVAQFKVLLQHAALLGTNYRLFKAFLTLLFFSMVRVSTLIPYVSTKFDQSRHMCVNDLQRTVFSLFGQYKMGQELAESKVSLHFAYFKEFRYRVVPS